MTSAGCGAGDRPRTSTPNGSVQRRPGRVPDGKPNSTGPGNPRDSRAITSRAVGPPARLVAAAAARRRRARAARASMPAQRSCVSMRSSRYGRSPTSSRNSTQPSGGVERERRAERRQRAASACRRQQAAASPAASASSPAGAQLAHRLRRDSSAQKRAAVVAVGPARKPALEHRPVERDDAAAAASASVSSAVMSL